MLVFKRSIGQSFYIGDNILVTVVGIRSYQVRVAIDAPKAIPVHREEIYRRIKHEGERGDGDGGAS